MGVGGCKGGSPARRWGKMPPHLHQEGHLPPDPATCHDEEPFQLVYCSICDRRKKSSPRLKGSSRWSLLPTNTPAALEGCHTQARALGHMAVPSLCSLSLPREPGSPASTLETKPRPDDRNSGPSECMEGSLQTVTSQRRKHSSYESYSVTPGPGPGPLGGSSHASLLTNTFLMPIDQGCGTSLTDPQRRRAGQRSPGGRHHHTGGRLGDKT